MTAAGNKKIWRGLVDYANTTDLGLSFEVSKNLARTLLDSMTWMARTAFGQDIPAMIAALTNREILFGQVEGKRVWLYFKSEEQLANQFRQQAIEYQPQVRHLLKWLSDPQQNVSLRARAFAFLYEHMKHIDFQRGDPAFAPEEEEFQYFTPWGDLKDDFPYWTFSYKDVADVICDFVQKEHEPGMNVPIRICKRPGCENLVTRFKKRQYCRTPECDRERQKRDDDVKQRKNRDNVFLCRLMKLPSATRRKRVRATIDRLREIESYWRDRNPSLAKHALLLLRLVP